MSDPIPFLAPRFVGPRFEGHSVPLEVLRDLSVLDEIIRETAKWHFLQANPGRKRVPRGFADEISLQVAAIDEGSAIPRILLCVAAGHLLAPNQTYYEQARESVVNAIDAAAHNEPVTPHLPESILPSFDSLGRSLLPDEAIEFRPENPERSARLDQIVRRKLLSASPRTQAVTEEVVLRGLIPEVNQDRSTFQLKLADGFILTAPMGPSHWDAVAEAFNAYQSAARVAVKGIVKRSLRSASPAWESFVSVEDVSLLEPRDLLARLDELRLLRAGWLDGKGAVPPGAGLDWFGAVFTGSYASDLVLPLVYPTAEGGLQLEWRLTPVEITLDVNLAAKSGEFHFLHLESGAEISEKLDLTSTPAWQFLGDKLRSAGGVA